MPLSKLQQRIRKRRIRYHQWAIQKSHIPSRSIDDIGRYTNPARTSRRKRKQKKDLLKMDEPDNWSTIPTVQDEDNNPITEEPKANPLPGVAVDSIPKSHTVEVPTTSKEHLSSFNDADSTVEATTKSFPSTEPINQDKFENVQLTATSVTKTSDSEHPTPKRTTSRKRSLRLGLSRPIPYSTASHLISKESTKPIETQTEARHHEFEVGEWVKVESGARIGRIGKIIALDEQNCRVDFGRDVQVVIPIAIVSLYEN